MNCKKRAISIRAICIFGFAFRARLKLIAAKSPVGLMDDPLVSIPDGHRNNGLVLIRQAPCPMLTAITIVSRPRILISELNIS
jgi:hypothetical protein